MNIFLHVTIANIIAFIQEFALGLCWLHQQNTNPFIRLTSYFETTLLIHVGLCIEKHWLCLYMSCFPSVHLDHQNKRGLVFFGRGMLYSDIAWSRSSDIYIGVIYLHMIFVFYFISPETVPFRCHFALYMIYLSLCM